MNEIAHEAWMAALADVEATPLEEDASALTVQQFAAELGIGRHAAESKLKKLIDAGKVTRVTKRIRRCDGQMITVNAYRLVTAP